METNEETKTFPSFHHSSFNHQPESHLQLSLSLTHLPKVDILTLSAAAARIPQGAVTPCSPPTSISSSHVLLCGPFKCRGLSRWRFSLKKWLMPVYFREAKPFGTRGWVRGELKQKRKENEKEGEIKRGGNGVNVWIAE